MYLRKADKNLSWSGYHLPVHSRDCPSKLKAESLQFLFPLPWRSAGDFLKSLGDLEEGGHNKKLFAHSGVVGVPAGDQEVADADNEGGLVSVSVGDQEVAKADNEDGLVIVLVMGAIVADSNNGIVLG